MLRWISVVRVPLGAAVSNVCVVQPMEDKWVREIDA
jgi:hypothetical protein